MRFTLLSLLALSCVACSSTQSNRVVSSATPVQKSSLIDRVKGLAGTWEMTGDDGKKQTVVYQVSSNGSTVREIMFPGAKHEMTNMYTMDGSELLMTHYCAVGNQPHMRASASQADRIEFKTAGVSNLTAGDQEYMGQMTLVFVDANHIRQEWQTIQGGRMSKDQTLIELTRRQ